MSTLFLKGEWSGNLCLYVRRDHDFLNTRPSGFQEIKNFIGICALYPWQVDKNLISQIHWILQSRFKSPGTNLMNTSYNLRTRISSFFFSFFIIDRQLIWNLRKLFFFLEAIHKIRSLKSRIKLYIYMKKSVSKSFLSYSRRPRKQKRHLSSIGILLKNSKTATFPLKMQTSTDQTAMG